MIEFRWILVPFVSSCCQWTQMAVFWHLYCDLKALGNRKYYLFLSMDHDIQGRISQLVVFCREVNTDFHSRQTLWTVHSGKPAESWQIHAVLIGIWKVQLAAKRRARFLLSRLSPVDGKCPNFGTYVEANVRTFILWRIKSVPFSQIGGKTWL